MSLSFPLEQFYFIIDFYNKKNQALCSVLTAHHVFPVLLFNKDIIIK